jgi:hypothetical protein
MWWVRRASASPVSPGRPRRPRPVAGSRSGGIADPDVPLPQIDPDARRRQLTALINTASLARTEPALYIIEDAHWIDPVSESMLANFLTVIPQTKLMILITYPPSTRERSHGGPARRR